MDTKRSVATMIIWKLSTVSSFYMHSYLPIFISDIGCLSDFCGICG